MREPAFDVPDGPFQRNLLWGQQQMHMLGHHDKFMQSIMPFTPIVLESLKKKLAIGSNLKEPPAIVRHSCDEECSGMHGPRRDGHRRRFYRVSLLSC